MTATPAAMLRDALSRLSMSQVELCRRSGLSAKHVNQIAQGKAGVSFRTAILFERVLGVPSREWNAAEAAHATAKLRVTAKPRPLTEAEFQGRVMDYAQRCGWMRVHYRPAQQRGKWVTAITGDVGAPDLILARNGRVLLVELKKEDGRFRPGQQEWLTAAGDNGRLWKPSHWDAIVEELK
jgi:transcriptional regulator with XRE-family HTH domain